MINQITNRGILNHCSSHGNHSHSHGNVF